MAVQHNVRAVGQDPPTLDALAWILPRHTLEVSDERGLAVRDSEIGRCDTAA
jgi:hypothetical protein